MKLLSSLDWEHVSLYSLFVFCENCLGAEKSTHIFYIYMSWSIDPLEVVVTCSASWKKLSKLSFLWLRHGITNIPQIFSGRNVVKLFKTSEIIAFCVCVCIHVCVHFQATQRCSFLLHSLENKITLQTFKYANMFTFHWWSDVHQAKPKIVVSFTMYVIRFCRIWTLVYLWIML